MQLKDDYESNGDQDESQIDQNHQAADTSGVGTERIGGGHRFHHNSGLGRVSACTRSSSMTLSTFRTNKKQDMGAINDPLGQTQFLQYRSQFSLELCFVLRDFEKYGRHV